MRSSSNEITSALHIITPRPKAAAAKPTQTRRRMRRCERSQSSAVRWRGSNPPGWVCGDRDFFIRSCAWPAMGPLVDADDCRPATSVLSTGRYAHFPGMDTRPRGRRRRTEAAEIRAPRARLHDHTAFSRSLRGIGERAGWQAHEPAFEPPSPMTELTEEQARAYMHKLLAAMSQAGGSDLFISDDFPPSMKAHGSMQPLTAAEAHRRGDAQAGPRDDERAPARGVRARRWSAISRSRSRASRASASTSSCSSSTSAW